MVYKKDPEYQRIKQVRQEAVDANEKYYFTGVACIRGHIAERYTISRNCIACAEREENKEYKKFVNRKITKEFYDGMLKAQWGLCAICKNKLGTGQDITIDHCHKSEVVRGLLCRYCNMGLGNFKDNITALRNAADYLEKFTK